MHSTNIQRSCAALLAFEAGNFVAHATVGVLTHRHAMWVCARSAKYLRMIHWRRRPSISRSELEIDLLDFSMIPLHLVYAVGKWCARQLGFRDLSMPNHTPPAPLFDASQ